MELLAWLSIIFALILIVYEDFSHRYIRFYWLIVILLSWIYLYYFNHLDINYQDIFTNLAILGFQFLFLNVYFSIKAKKWICITREYLGWGDILFLLTICLFFTPIEFLFFYVVTLIATLITSLIIRYIKKDSFQTIPLAGFFAIAMLIYIFEKQFFHYFAI